MIILFKFTDLSASESSTLAWSGMGSTWYSRGIGKDIPGVRFKGAQRPNLEQKTPAEQHIWGVKA